MPTAVDVDADGDDNAATDITQDASDNDESATDVDAVEADTSSVLDADTHTTDDNAVIDIK